MNEKNPTQNSRVADSSQYFEMVPENRKKYTIEEAKAAALAGSLALRKQLIAQRLTSQGIDPETIDIDAMIEQKTSELIPKKKSNKYFKSNDGTMIKIDSENLVCYKFDFAHQVWIQDQTLFTQLEKGTIQGEFIEFQDIYSSVDSLNQDKSINL